MKNRSAGLRLLAGWTRPRSPKWVITCLALVRAWSRLPRPGNPAETATFSAGASAPAQILVDYLGDEDPPPAVFMDLRAFNIAFNEYLGLSGTGSFNTLVPGVLRVYEVSILLDPELSALQPDAFPLVSLEFRMQDLINSQIEILKAVLSDGDGIPLYAAFQSANVYAVPVPPALILLASALIGFGGIRRLGQRYNNA